MQRKEDKSNEGVRGALAIYYTTFPRVRENRRDQTQFVDGGKGHAPERGRERMQGERGILLISSHPGRDAAVRLSSSSIILALS